MNKKYSKHISAVKHVVLYGFGTTVRRLIGFIMLPVYTRYLSPADYGIISLLTVSILIVDILLGARFGSAIQKFYYENKEQSERNLVVSTSLYISILFSTFGAGLIFSNSEIISYLLFGDNGKAIYVKTLCFLSVTAVVENYGLIYIRLQERPVLFVTISLTKMFVQLLLNILLVVQYELGVMGVLISSVVSSSIYCVCLGIYVF